MPVGSSHSEFESAQIMELWRFAVTSYLWKANRDGLLRQSATPDKYNDHFSSNQTQRRWNIHITPRITRRHLRLRGPFVRRLPDSQRRILRVTGSEVVYQSKDTRTQSVLDSMHTGRVCRSAPPHVHDRFGTPCASLAC